MLRPEATSPHEPLRLLRGKRLSRAAGGLWCAGAVGGSPRNRPSPLELPLSALRTAIALNISYL